MSPRRRAAARASRSRCSSRTLVNVRYLIGLRELERGARSSSPSACGSSATSATREAGARSTASSSSRRSARSTPAWRSCSRAASASRRTTSRYAHVGGARGRRARARAAARARRGAARRQGRGRARGGPRARQRSRARRIARFAEETFVGRTERDLAWRLDELFHELGADGAGVRDDRRRGPEQRARRTRGPATARSRPARPSSSTRARKLDGYCSDCTRTFATGPLPERLREAYEVCLEAQLAGLEARARRGDGRRGGRGRARRDRRRRLRRGVRPRPRPRRRPGGPRGAAGSRANRATRSSQATSSPSSPGSTSRASAGSGSRTS